MIRKLLITLTVVIGTIGVGWAALTGTPQTAYSVSTAAELQAALTELNKASAAITSTITLTKDLDISELKVMGGGGDENPFQGMFFLGNKNVSLTIDGANFKISGTNTTQGTTGSNTGKVIEQYQAKTYVFYSHAAAKLTFKNLTVGGTNIIGFNLHSLSDVVFNGVTVAENAEGGIHLNSSKVTEATNLITSGNKKFAIKLSREGDKLPGIVLGEGCNLQEMDVPKIGFYDRKAFATGEKDTPTKAEFEAMVSGTIGLKWNRGWQMATLHTDNNTLPVRVWTPDTERTISEGNVFQAYFGKEDFATIPTIKLAAGTYTGNFIMKEGVNVTGADKATTILNGEAKGRVVSYATGVVYDGAAKSATAPFQTATKWSNLTIQGGQTTDGGAGAFICANVTLENCIITGNETVAKSPKAADKLTPKGGGVMCYFGGTVNKCDIHNNTSVDGGGGVVLNGGGTVSNSLIHANKAPGDHSGGINTRNKNDAPMLITNCVIYANEAAQIAGVSLNGNIKMVNSLVHSNKATTATVTQAAAVNVGSTAAEMLNCTVWGNTAGGNANVPDVVVGNYSTAGKITNCIMESHLNDGNRGVITYSASGSALTGTGNIGTVTPMFVSTTAASENYALQFGSPCIGTGNPAGIETTTDLAGNPRLLGGKIDMGAYQSKAMGATMYVSVDGSGIKDGSSASNSIAATAMQVAISNPSCTTLILAAGEYALTKAFNISKSITLQGAGADKTKIKGAITIKGSSTETAANVAIKGIKFDYSPTKLTTGRCQSLIQMIDGKTNLVVENSVIENKTAGYEYGYGTSSYIKMQNVFQLDSAATGTLKITNTQIHLLANNQRAISAHGQLGSVSLINTIITGLDNGTGQYGACIHRDNTVLTLDNSTITLNNHYGIWVIKGKGQQIHITNKSLVSGFGALYLMYPSGVHAIVSGGSTLTGITKNNGPSDSFGAIIFEGTTNSTVEIVDSYVGNQFKATQTASMMPILINSNSKSEGNTVKLKGKSIVRTLKNATNPFMVDYGENPDPNVDKNYVVVEGTEVQFKDETDKDCIVINNQDGTFRNAAVTVVDAIVYGSAYGGTTYYQWAIANKGDMVMATETVTTKVLSLLNAAKDQFFEKPTSISTWEAYAVPDSIVINCKDAYLVTGEKAAIAFAATERDKAVFWLKQEATAFSTVAVGNNWRIINGNTTWNDAANANRSVEIKAGAKLTINVAMALDSVRMDEGAELITALPVTAKTLQAKYTVAANKWKPFAFPVSGMTVKDAKDDKTAVTVQSNSAADGVWFAGLSATTTATFEHKGAFAQAGIIAANAATEILVASPAASDSVSLITKPEPTAPTDATAQFLFVANPNLFAMTLTQTAYVLNEAGTAFERRDGAVIQPFQSYVLADAGTTATLRSLRVDGVVTENEVIPTDGYYVESTRGAIVIHTAEPVEVVVVDMTGKMVYHSRATMDGCVIALPAGIYAVNRQMVIVK